MHEHASARQGENETIMRSRKFLRLLSVIGLLFLLVGPAQAAEFSATNVVRVKGNQEMQGKLYVKGDKTRLDSAAFQVPVIHIMRLDKKTIWLLVPGRKAYMESPFDRADYAGLMDLPEKLTNKKLVGTEVLNGYETEKYELESGPQQMQKTIWFSKKLGIPLKVEATDKSTVSVCKDIKEGGVDDALFEIPAGYQKKNADEIMKYIMGENLKK